MKKRYYLYFLVLVGLFFYGLYLQTAPTPEQNQLLTRIHSITKERVLSVAVSPNLLEGTECLTVTNQLRLQEFVRALSSADTKPIGGHNGPIYECLLIINFRQEVPINLIASANSIMLKALTCLKQFWRKLLPKHFLKRKSELTC